MYECCNFDTDKLYDLIITVSLKQSRWIITPSLNVFTKLKCKTNRSEII